MAQRLTILASIGSSDPAIATRQRLAASASPTISVASAHHAAAEFPGAATQPLRLMPFRRPSLRANFAWSLVGNVTSAGCAWLIVVAIVKLGSMEMAGYYAFSQAVVVPLLGFSMLQLRAIYATDAGNEYAFGHYLGLRTITSSLALAAIAIVAYVTISERTLQHLTIAVGFGAAAESMADVIYGGLQQRERLDCVSLSMMCRSIIALAAAVGTLWLTGSIVQSLWAGSIAKVLVLAALDIPLGIVVMGAAPSWRDARRWCSAVVREARDFKRLLNLSWYSLPLGLVMFLLTLQTSLPRYFIEKWLDSKQLGIFSALSYAAISGTLVVGALAQSAAPRIAQHYLNRDARSYYIFIGKLAAVGGAFGICGVALAIQFGRPVLTLLYAAEYAEHNDVFVWLAAAAGVGYVSTFFGWGMTAARQIRIQLPLFASVIAVMFAAGYLLIPRWGLTGAAITVLIGAVVQLAEMFVLILRAIPESCHSAAPGGLVRTEARS